MREQQTLAKVLFLISIDIFSISSVNNKKRQQLFRNPRNLPANFLATFLFYSCLTWFEIVLFKKLCLSSSFEILSAEILCYVGFSCLTNFLLSFLCSGTFLCYGTFLISLTICLCCYYSCYLDLWWVSARNWWLFWFIVSIESQYYLTIAYSFFICFFWNF